jgi:hypothetical protein
MTVAQFCSNQFNSRTVCPRYMGNQTEITPSMRSTLVGWMVQLSCVHFPDTTLYVAVNLVDRFLEMNHIRRLHLQLVGMACMLIASKYEDDTEGPTLRYLVLTSDNAYSMDELRDMELTILQALDYRVTYDFPNPLEFLHHYLEAARADLQVIRLATYLLEGTLLSYKLLQYKPGELAAAAVYIACRNARAMVPWTRRLETSAGYVEHQVLAVATNVLCEKSSGTAANKHNTIDFKYGKACYGEVSRCPIFAPTPQLREDIGDFLGIDDGCAFYYNYQLSIDNDDSTASTLDFD